MIPCRATRVGAARLDIDAEHGGVRSRRREGAAVDEYAAGSRAGKPHDHLERGRFAGAVRPEKTGDRARANGKRQIVDHPDRAVALRQPLDDNRRDLWGNTIRLHADRIGHDRLARIGSKTELRLRPETEGRLPPIFDLRWMSVRMLPRDRPASELRKTSEVEVVPDGDRSRRASARPCSLFLES